MSDEKKKLRFLVRTIERNLQRKKELLRDLEECDEKIKRHKKEFFELRQVRPPK